MPHTKDFKNESQDARRKDEHNSVHPDEARGKSDKSYKTSSKPSNSKNKLKK
ncbi:Uncharacterised protein [Legionella beliardensis]|uniref:Uncharacterized protein n=1 Tax=Legionella beliardensis TaxID=91822 RepID=A0A378I524_9GAMM|nr:hypothetical protein [Legionella beliardensis]STX29825.1 Uncharacterised protein [Legionella beliardensis]